MANRVDVSEQNFMAYLERLTVAVGHADRHEPLRVYLEGLLLPGDRKSVEPMAARVDPRNVPSRHQSMHHFVATSPWDAPGRGVGPQERRSLWTTRAGI
jgi:SRSO17 transposase